MFAPASRATTISIRVGTSLTRLPGAAAWTTAAAYWTCAPYSTVATFCDYPAQPIVYDYGSTVVYQDDRVYYNAEPVATAQEYAAQATHIAVVGQEAKPAENVEWQSLGVFAVLQGEEKDANHIFQIAINKEGILRGNYYSASDGYDDSHHRIRGKEDAASRMGYRRQEGNRVRDWSGKPGPTGNVDASPLRQGTHSTMDAGSPRATRGTEVRGMSFCLRGNVLAARFQRAAKTTVPNIL